MIGQRSHDDDRDSWADEQRQKQRDDVIDRPGGTYTLPGYGTENHPSRRVDRDSIERRMPPDYEPDYEAMMERRQERYRPGWA